MKQKASDAVRYFPNEGGPVIGAVTRRMIEKDGRNQLQAVTEECKHFVPVDVASNRGMRMARLYLV